MQGVKWIGIAIGIVLIAYVGFWLFDEYLDIDQGHLERQRFEHQVETLQAEQQLRREEIQTQTAAESAADGGCSDVVRYVSQTRPYIDQITSASQDAGRRFEQLSGSPELAQNHIWRGEIADAARELTDAATGLRDMSVPQGAEKLGAAFGNTATATLSMARLLSGFSLVGDPDKLIGVETDAINVIAALEDATAEIDWLTLACS